MTHLANADETTIKAFSDAAKEINIDIVKALLGDFNWRTRISGAFFAAINSYQELEDILGKHLLKSEVCYAGSGYCLALATFATDKAKDYLIAYLDYYLDRKDRIRLKSWGILEKVVVLQLNKTDKKHWKRIRKKNC